MTNKLVVVADSKGAKFFNAVGLKVNEQIKHLEASLLITTHKKQELRQGFNSGGGSPSHFYDPHSDIDAVERNEFAKIVVSEINLLNSVKKYDELIIVAEPKMLGDLRNNLSKELKKIVSKEISKELIHCDAKALSKHIFA